MDFPILGITVLRYSFLWEIVYNSGELWRNVGFLPTFVKESRRDYEKCGIFDEFLSALCGYFGLDLRFRA